MHFMTPYSMPSTQPVSGGEGYYLLLTCIVAIVLWNSFFAAFIFYSCVGKEVNSYLLKLLGRGEQIKFRSMDQLPHDKISKQVTFHSRVSGSSEAKRVVTAEA